VKAGGSQRVIDEVNRSLHDALMVVKVEKFAEALESIPLTLTKNAVMN